LRQFRSQNTYPRQLAGNATVGLRCPYRVAGSRQDFSDDIDGNSGDSLLISTRRIAASRDK
jgi:hypothetical protein